jgi:hypothetical protein
MPKIAGVRVDSRELHYAILPTVWEEVEEYLIFHVKDATPEQIERMIRWRLERHLSLVKGRPVVVGDKSWAYWRGIVAPEWKVRELRDKAGEAYK